MSRVVAVLRFIGRSTRRVAVTVVGVVLLAAGAVMLVTPGPGWLTIAAGLAVLATEYMWARRALAAARERTRKAVAKARGSRRSSRGT